MVRFVDIVCFHRRGLFTSKWFGFVDICYLRRGGLRLSTLVHLRRRGLLGRRGWVVSP
jgi:hypothetical protein